MPWPHPDSARYPDRVTPQWSPGWVGLHGLTGGPVRVTGCQHSRNPASAVTVDCTTTRYINCRYPISCSGNVHSGREDSRSSRSAYPAVAAQLRLGLGSRDGVWVGTWRGLLRVGVAVVAAPGAADPERPGSAAGEALGGCAAPVAGALRSGK